MAGLTGIKVYVANFFDEKGEFLGSKTYHRGWYPPKQKMFMYADRAYHIKNEVSRIHETHFPYAFDYYYSTYTIDNPDPLQLTTEIKPLIDARHYKIMLDSRILEQLNSVRKKGILDFLTSKSVIIILGIIAVVVYFLTGGSLTGGVAESAVIGESVNQTAKQAVQATGRVVPIP